MRDDGLVGVFELRIDTFDFDWPRELGERGYSEVSGNVVLRDIDGADVTTITVHGRSDNSQSWETILVPTMIGASTAAALRGACASFLADLEADPAAVAWMSRHRSASVPVP
jgi:hypothetical protein